MVLMLMHRLVLSLAGGSGISRVYPAALLMAAIT